MGVPDQDGSETVAVTAREQLLARLLDEPGAFAWQQAVRVLEDSAYSGHAGFTIPGFAPEPGEESPRLAASAEMDHAYADVSEFVPGGNDNVDKLILSLSDASQRRTLLGGHGVLPSWYSELALERLASGDGTLVEFLSIFEHRLLSLVYRGWWHYRADFRREKNTAGLALPDVDAWFDAVAGLGTPGQRERLQGGIGWLIRRFAPLFANAARPAAGLESILSAYAGTGVRVCEMVVQWRRLDRKDLNRLPAAETGSEGHCTLGRDLVLGDTVPEAQSNFDVILGPMSWRMFTSFLPDPAGDRLEGLCDLVRLFAGSERSFGVRLQLDGGEAAGICLGGGADGAGYLGWNVWLATDGLERMASEAFFVFDELDG